MKQKTIEQHRAAFALERIRQIEGQVKHGEFRSYARALPAMIHMNGLGQAMAFCRSKGRTRKGDLTTYGRLYEIVSAWLTREGQPLGPSGDLLERMAEVDMFRYRVAQAEALALMEWVRKFAVAFLEDPDDQGAENAAD